MFGVRATRARKHATNTRRSGSTRSKDGMVGPTRSSISTASSFKLKKVKAKPKPYGGTQPVHHECWRVARRPEPSRSGTAMPSSCRRRATRWMRPTKKVASVKEAQAMKLGRELGVYTVGVAHLPSDDEGSGGLSPPRPSSIRADWSAVDKRAIAFAAHAADTFRRRSLRLKRSHFAHGNSGVPIVGDPDPRGRRNWLELSGARASPASRCRSINYGEEFPYVSAARCCRGSSAQACGFRCEQSQPVILRCALLRASKDERP